jgi:hypothetical protein
MLVHNVAVRLAPPLDVQQLAIIAAYQSHLTSTCSRGILWLARSY